MHVDDFLFACSEAFNQSVIGQISEMYNTRSEDVNRNILSMLDLMWYKILTIQ